MKTLARAIVLCCACLLFVTLSMSQTPSGYTVVKKVQIGGEGGWDYLLADPATHRLYVSHGNSVVVLDTKTDQVVGMIPNTPGVHGIALNPRAGRGYTSNGRAGTVTVFDLKTLNTLDTINVEARNPDAILYDPFSDRLFTFNGRSANATAIDPNTNKVIGKVALKGKPEFAVTDLKGKIYVNIEDSNLVTVFDPKTLAVEAEWPLAPGEEPSGLAIDRERGRLFSVCGNKMMVILDAATGKVVSTVPTGPGTDAAAYDPGTRLAFASNGDGTLTVIRQESADKYMVLENVPTQPRSRTMTLDLSTHRLYLSGALFGPTPPATPEQPRPRPVMEPGSFMVQILEQK
jgi:DNA-binding beta-propeller fold protein YncE